MNNDELTNDEYFATSGEKNLIDTWKAIFGESESGESEGAAENE